MFNKDKLFFILPLLFLVFLLNISSNLEEVKATSRELTGRDLIADVVDMVSPGVVNIIVYQHENKNPVATGSGFIIDETGLIITNNHVIEKGNIIIAKLADGRSFSKIEVVGADPTSDIAVLQIAHGSITYLLPTLELGDSDRIRVGEWVIAFGSPFALQLGNQLTVTTGIISTKNRTVERERTVYQNFLQTDAAINPGNSGGPLVNLDGKVIGINTAILAYAQGIGFAIPVNHARKIIDQLVTHGEVKRPWLGISITGIPFSIQEKYNLKDTQGAYVDFVEPGSPAHKAGIIQGDIIFEINNKKITSPGELITTIHNLEVGEKVLLTVNHQGKIKHIMTTLVEKH